MSRQVDIFDHCNATKECWIFQENILTSEVRKMKGKWTFGLKSDVVCKI